MKLVPPPAQERESEIDERAMPRLPHCLDALDVHHASLRQYLLDEDLVTQAVEVPAFVTCSTSASGSKASPQPSDVSVQQSDSRATLPTASIRKMLS